MTKSVSGTFETKGSKGSAIRLGPPSAWIPKRQVARYRGVEWFSRRRVKRGKEGLGCVSLPPSGAHLPSPQQSRTVRSDQELRLRSRTNESLLLSPTIGHFPPPHDRAAPRELFDLLPTLRYPFLRTPHHSHAPSPIFSPSFSSPSCLSPREFTRAVFLRYTVSFFLSFFLFFFFYSKRIRKDSSLFAGSIGFASSILFRREKEKRFFSFVVVAWSTGNIIGKDIYHRLTTTSTFGGGVVKVVMVVYRGKPKKESVKKVEEGREGEREGEVEVEEERKQ